MGYIGKTPQYLSAIKGSDISSATNITIDGSSSYFDITGTTTITGMTVDADRAFTLQFDGIVILTHSSTLVLPADTNITTAAGDTVTFQSVTANSVIAVNVNKADGTAIVAGAGGDLRNYIIDGDFTQWPEGTSATTVVTNKYGPALWEAKISHDGASTCERSTDVPTVAASNHQSAYSLLYKCTGTDSSIGSGQKLQHRYHVTGSDFAELHQQEVTFSFWCKTASANSGDTYYFTLQNSDTSRSYVQNFAPTSTWTKFSYTINLDTSGTWLFTEADMGLKITFSLAQGTDSDDGTVGSWVGTSEFWAAGTAISNFLDSTSNEIYFSQVSLVLGSTAPTFLASPTATIANQVAYYIERWDFTVSGQYIGSSFIRTGSSARTTLFFTRKRIAPTITSTAAGTFEAIGSGGSHIDGTGIAINFVTTFSMQFRLDSGGTWQAGGGILSRDLTDTCNITIDARH
jgi:hypothetical protein